MLTEPSRVLRSLAFAARIADAMTVRTKTRRFIILPNNGIYYSSKILLVFIILLIYFLFDQSCPL